jgi:hypothetical protein
MKDAKRSPEEKKAVLEFYATVLDYLSIKCSTIVASDHLARYIEPRKQHTHWKGWDTQMLVEHITSATTHAGTRMQINCIAFDDLADQMRNPNAAEIALAFSHPPRGYHWPDEFASIQNERTVADWDPENEPKKNVVAMTILTTCPERVKELVKELGPSCPIR